MKEIRERLEQLASELTKSKEECRAAVRAAAELRRKTEAEKRQKTLHSFFSRPLQHEVRPRAAPETLGEGYTNRNITSGCFAQHVKAIETRIIEVANDDPLKQLQLASAVVNRMQGIRHLRDKDQEAWGYIRNSLKAFFDKLQDRYHGRYPNHIRAAQQAVCAAIANSVPPRKLHVIQEAVGVSTDRLSEGRRSREWSHSICRISQTRCILRCRPNSG